MLFGERKKMVNNVLNVKNDLTGKTFGRLTVIKQVEDYVTPKGKHSAKWLCKCNCGNFTEVKGAELKRRRILSCGCLKRELLIENNKRYKKKYNKYEICGSYVTMYTDNDEPFDIDLEDFWKVKDICWHKSCGYICGVVNRKIIRLHRYVTNCPDSMDVDHINHDTTDNRKKNLRIATRSQNMMNRKIYSNNTSGKVGVKQYGTNNKWSADISVNGTRIYLGSFENYDDAVKSRKQAEEKYFGKWSYDNSVSCRI